MIELCDEALAEAAGDDVRSARILALRAWVDLLQADVHAVDRSTPGRRSQRAERAGDPALLAVVIARVGQAEMWAAEVTPGLLERGAEIEERLGLSLEYMREPAPRSRPTAHAAGRDRAGPCDARGAGGEGDGARRRGHAGCLILWSLSMLEWMAGRWQRALDHAAAAHELAEQTLNRHGITPGWAGSRRWSRRTSGSSSEARASAEEGLGVRAGDLERDLHRSSSSACSADSSSRSATWRRPARYLRELPGRLLAAGCNDPTAPRLGGRDRDAGRPRRARAGPRLPRASTSERAASRESMGRRRRCSLPWPARRRRGRPRRLRSPPSSAPSPS